MAAATILLDRNSQATPDADVITGFWGEAQLFVTAYSSPIQLQARVKGEATWIDAKYDGQNITLNSLGDSIDVRLAPGYEYRLTTSSPGSEVRISTYTFKYSPKP